jgi:predicted nucleotidyltransferase
MMGVRYGSAVERRARLRRELDEILSSLVVDATERVILFGSAASGEVSSTSDLDLLVIRRDHRRPADRVDELYRRIRPRVALDLLVYTPEELEEARRTSSFVRSALREGVVLYDRSGTLARASQA